MFFPTSARTRVPALLLAFITARRTTAADTTTPAGTSRADPPWHYDQINQQLQTIWDDLAVVAAPGRRAGLLEQAARLQDQRAELIPLIYQAAIQKVTGLDVPTRLQGIADSAAVLRQAAAIEQARATVPPRPPLPDLHITTSARWRRLWAELAEADSRAGRAELLLRLGEVARTELGETVAATLTNLADTEISLAADTAIEQVSSVFPPIRYAGGHLLAPSEPNRRTARALTVWQWLVGCCSAIAALVGGAVPVRRLIRRKVVR